MPREVGAALLASAEGYTPRATQLLEAARERLGTIQEIAGALADDLPAPKTGPSRSRRRRRKRKPTDDAPRPLRRTGAPAENGTGEQPREARDGRRRRRAPQAPAAAAEGTAPKPLRRPSRDARRVAAAPGARNAARRVPESC